MKNQADPDDGFLGHWNQRTGGSVAWAAFFELPMRIVESNTRFHGDTTYAAPVSLWASDKIDRRGKAMCINDCTKYEEACTSIRFYSSVILRVRIVEIAQGLAILTAVVYLAKEGHYGYSLFACGFGVLFTTALYLQQQFYLRQFEHLLKFVLTLEAVAKDKRQAGTWTIYNAVRDHWFANPLARNLVVNGPFLLLLVSLLLTGAFNLANIV